MKRNRRDLSLAMAPPENDLSLTNIGKEVVEKMLEIGMIVDLTHSPRAVREEVFAINEKRDKPRPLVFTHVGTQELFDTHNGLYDTYQYYDTRKDEILRISKCDGVVGVIAENYWLKGTDTHLKVPHSKDFTNGAKYMVETIQKINSFTLNQDYSNISIGSDFDGLADAPKDLYNPSQFGNLIAEMKKQGLNDEQIMKVTNGNAMRVLKNGWL